MPLYCNDAYMNQPVAHAIRTRQCEMHKQLDAITNASSAPLQVSLAWPVVAEEYWEYIDVLEAVGAYVEEEAATWRRPFAFVELGCGYGHWSFAAHAALRRRQSEQHGETLKSPAPRMLLVDVVETLAPAIQDLAMLNNVHDVASSIHFHNAFIVGSVAAEKGATAAAAEENVKLYGRLWGTGVGGNKRVPSSALSSLLARYDMPCVLDMVDIDIQGSEYPTKPDGTAGIFAGNETIQLLSRRARRVHIGLHALSGTRRNAELLALFRAWGWKVQQFMMRPNKNTRTNFAAGMPVVHAETPFGPVDLGDGIASFRNTRRVLGCS